MLVVIRCLRIKTRPPPTPPTRAHTRTKGDDMIDLMDPDTIRFKMSEKAFQAQVVAMANIFGWLVFHQPEAFQRCPKCGHERIHHPKDCDAGFPDLVMARSARVIFAELKTEKGKVSDAQQGWIDALGGVTCNNWDEGPEVYLWRPSDIDEIEEKLL